MAVAETSKSSNQDPMFDLSNIYLLDFDEQQDQMLAQFFNNNEKLLQQNQNPNPTVQNILSKPTNFLIVPRMFFPNSKCDHKLQLQQVKAYI